MTADPITLNPAPTRPPVRGRAWTGVAALVDAFEAGCQAESELGTALLALPDGSDGGVRPVASWPRGPAPSPNLLQAAERLGRDPRSIDERLDGEPGAPRLVGLHVGGEGELRAVVVLRFDGRTDAIGDALSRWHARLHGRLDLWRESTESAGDLDRMMDALAHGGAAAEPRPGTASSPGIGPAVGAPARGAATGGPSSGPASAGGPGTAPGLPASLLYRDGPGGRDPGAAPVFPPAAVPAPEPEPAVPRPSNGRPAASPVELARLLECQAVVADAASLDDALLGLVSTIARQYRCARVAFGWARRAGVRVAVMSDGVGDRPSAETVAPVATAMDEALDQATCVAWPTLPSREMPVNVAQAQLARLGQSAAVCAVPLAERGRALGALTLERAGPAFEPAVLVELQRLASLLAPTLALRRRADRPIRTMVADLADAFAGRRGRTAWIVGAALLSSAVAATVHVPYRVSGAARVEGASQRTMTAPADGFVARVHVRPGDTVAAGQPMVDLDDRDLLLERMRWSTEAEQAGRQAIEAVAREDRAQYAQHAARAAQARAQLALADAQLGRLRVVAPFDGLVLSGDLTQSLGAPVKAGDVLLSMAPVGRHRVIVDVDERDVALVAVDGAGTLALAANAGLELPLKVVRVSPAAVARDGRTVFEVEAATPDESELRPGYQGVAKIAAGERALGRVLLERPWRAVADRLWAWGW
ncbi:MAG: hypothetical protein RJA99_3952 [Pseudomonadota bacterium]|jgi:biotin carboxyl carrier protein